VFTVGGNMAHPLVEEFDLYDVAEIDNTVEIPENPDLDTVITLALTAYKQNMEILGFVEPKNRIKYIEVCERMLGQAKDAMYKKESLKLQEKKMIAQKQPTVIATKEQVLIEQVSRGALYD